MEQQLKNYYRKENLKKGSIQTLLLSLSLETIGGAGAAGGGSAGGGGGGGGDDDGIGIGASLAV
ncbi:hypothetical protein J3Q64DRAFT_1847184 [Phycomyces blakesleeanus]|uniref:Uncharacterized protein n=2 Tax=Phycomyces blakesleeanus TaxID=4837 RepID=A0A162Q158_PHYB8|nr:hypothetical protein PHYBLDRAFT_143238 [Phycomyces blakesleeanus NRRL 1555(-)]OAD76256.1 hypothetical protein PHYBLDRAFT_143238 [Phycomyces blakesleeanus NRRL 1555(-)]|eukprot:XP_018294296.1 hypothetical protein PHYBLDRAFT_143238 [Phycomyces blakesleeanus NRRL 1555(-)]